MGQQKGGKKLKRTGAHKAMYSVQYLRTARNKMLAYARDYAATGSQVHKDKIKALQASIATKK